MKGVRTIGLSFLLTLIVASHAFAFSNSVQSRIPSDLIDTSLTIEATELQNPVQPIYLEIEITNFGHTVTEVHRLVSLSVLSNRIIPTNHNFSGVTLIPAPVNFSSPVPIFIKGHVLRH